jgi:hypothetical protein
MRSLKSALDRLQRRSRTGITHSIGVRWGWINTWWKENFMRHSWKLFFFYMVWFGQIGKFVKEEAVIKCDGEGDDDNVTRRLGKPLIEHKWSCQAWRVDQWCMNTFKSCMKDHGPATIRRYVRKSSSMTLNEALCGRQPSLYIYIYMAVYIVLFNRTIK